MRKIILNTLFLFFFVFIFTSKTFAGGNTFLISEFSSASSTEWVEIVNTDQNEAKSLDGYTLTDASGNILKTLSGIVPRGGFLTFDLPANSLPDNGGIFKLVDNGGGDVLITIYGSEPGAFVSAPSSTQTAYYKFWEFPRSWDLTSSATKGWCNPGTPNCPTISDIVAQINASGVKTNLGEQADFSRITGLYFQKSQTNDPEGPAIGKITFLQEMNFTDRDALTWMSQLNTKLDMAEKGKIGLDADLIKNLIDTKAQLEMYGLIYSDVEIDVYNTDGTPGDKSIVSNINYSNGHLVFNVEHFTTFRARQKQTTSSSGGGIYTPSCSSMRPDHSPDLFQIDTTLNTAKLYFTPVNNAVDHYFISYGFWEGDERFGVEFKKGYYDGVIDYTINYLNPGTTYYFKVRAGNGCATGDWSAWVKATTDSYYIQRSENNFSSSEIKEKDKTTLLEKTDEKKTEEKKEVLPSATERKIINTENQEKKTSFFNKVLQWVLGIFGR